MRILYYKFYMIIIINLKNRNIYNIMDNGNQNNDFNQGMNNIIQAQNNNFNLNNKDNKNKKNKSIFALIGNNIMNNNKKKNQNQNNLNMEINNMNNNQGNISKDNDINNDFQNLNNQENINSTNNTIFNNYIKNNMMNNGDLMNNNNFKKNMNNNNNMINNFDFKNFMTFMNNINNNNLNNNNMNNNHNMFNNLNNNNMNNNHNMFNNLNNNNMNNINNTFNHMNNNNMNNINNMFNHMNNNHNIFNNLNNNNMNNINNMFNNMNNNMNNNNMNNINMNNINNMLNNLNNNNMNNNHSMPNNMNINNMNNNHIMLNNNMNNNIMNNNIMNNNIMNNNIMNNDIMNNNIMNNNMNNNNMNNNNMNNINMINNLTFNNINFSFSNILCEVIWIHQNKLKDLNNLFVSFLSQKNLKFTEVSDVNSCIEIMKSSKFEYKCIYVIVSGSKFLEFVESFNNNLSEIKCIPIITIFTLKREKWQQLELANHPFYNPGGIHVQYSELIQAFIKFDSIVKTRIKANIIPPKKNDCFNFETIDSIPKFYFPFIYSKLIEKINDEDINEFNNNILKYNNEEISKLIYPLTFLKEIPIQLLVKFWLRIYTLETDFYSNMNCKLMKFEGKEFYTYIKLLYFAINKEYVKSKCDITLYRGDIMNNEELNIIKNKIKSNLVIDKLIYGRRFQSFSESQDVAEKFIKDKFSRKGLSTNYILYQINPFIGDIRGAKCYNIAVKEFSKFQEEEEYLFLPYSPFVLESIEQISIPIDDNLGIAIYLIELSYIGIYKDIIKTSMKNISSLDDISFDLLKKSFLDEIKKYKIFENEENIWDKIKMIIKNNDI